MREANVNVFILKSMRPPGPENEIEMASKALCLILLFQHLLMHVQSLYTPGDFVLQLLFNLSYDRALCNYFLQIQSCWMETILINRSLDDLVTSRWTKESGIKPCLKACVWKAHQYPKLCLYESRTFWIQVYLLPCVLLNARDNLRLLQRILML